MGGVQFHPEYTRELVAFFAAEYGHEWKQSPFVGDKETVLAQTEQIPDTYWLMEALLENMDKEFG